MENDKKIISDVSFLNKDTFEENFSIQKVSKNSLVLKCKKNQSIIHAHRKVVNKILNSEELLPCVIESILLPLNGVPQLWLATVFTC